MSDVSLLGSYGPKSTEADATEQYLIPEYREVTIDISTLSATLKGNFTSGILKIVKIGNQVTISSPSTLAHTSTALPVSGSIIPDWARPTSNTYNVYCSLTARICRCGVRADGKFETFYQTWTGTSSAQEESGTVVLISYNV